MLHHAFASASNGVSAATGQGIAGVGGKGSDFAGWHMQAGRTRLQGPQHDAVPWQDQPA